ncbi:MAG: hypothetical protein HY645_13120 [Acidobacteria bacterium]|nr:hypothetical protein [Acidobacteriota bacterium]
MKQLLVLTLLLLAAGTIVRAEDCQATLQGLRLPAKVKSTGQPRRVRWEQVDRTLNQLEKSLQGMECEFHFEELLKSSRTDLFFPVTNSVARLVPEASLRGVELFDSAGELLGTYEGAVPFEKTGSLQVRESYRLVSFQFKDKDGEIQYTGNRLLLDDFLMKWEQIKERVALSTLRKD